MKKQIITKNILQFKITLNDSAPRIWRRILVPSGYTFFDLHCAIQDAMGWGDAHLHAFYIKEQKNSDRITIESPNPDGDDCCVGETHDERTERIADYFGKTIKQCVYCYDFGDNWNHTVLFERVLPRKAKANYPQCIAGANACPPEDCGSVWGYENLQKIIKNPSHEEHADMLVWLDIDDPKEFDPHEFNPSEAMFRNPKKCLAEWNEGFGI
ncbi:plasmid pRiA4b ORF-3 family protein [Patescibacteria group bacterium]|nr:plasmid pRiA4b ORF-3 family protein [Patescibacteria group bacterium]